MLGEQAQHLLRDVFAGQVALTTALSQAHPIKRRIVRWGSDEPHAVPHSALVIGGSRLESALREQLPSPSGEGPGVGALPTRQGMSAFPASPDIADSPHPNPSPKGEGLTSANFVLSTKAPPASTLLRFGRREAAATPVALQPGTDPHAALVEAIDQGWLFLIPTGAKDGWLLTVGALPEDALRESRLVATAVAATADTAIRFETAPRILGHPATPGDLTLGTAALAFDPICGDGVATAVRGGILAAAIAAELATETALDRAAMIGHYRAMLIAAMRRHLAVSAPFYERGGQGTWWREQAEATARGHAWCTRQLAAAGEAQFVLIGDRIALRDRVA
ncbi:hypothetical protein [Novosphingobium sp.]|uniref:hypothetical protein n=1 Tax=Novosphingobium sp. TaxID=1874826 RepID=UPI003B52A03D